VCRKLRTAHGVCLLLNLFKLFLRGRFQAFRADERSVFLNRVLFPDIPISLPP
jgi:hypothetical protein